MSEFEKWSKVIEDIPDRCTYCGRSVKEGVRFELTQGRNDVFCSKDCIRSAIGKNIGFYASELERMQECLKKLNESESKTYDEV